MIYSAFAIFVGLILITSTVVWNDIVPTMVFAIMTKFMGLVTLLAGIKTFVREDLFPDYMVIPKLGDE